MIKKSLIFFIPLFFAIAGCNKNSSPVTNLLPTITGFLPSSGPVGTTVAITGTNFNPAPIYDTVLFNGVPILATNASSTSITVTVPTGASTGAIKVIVGSHTVTSSSSFTVTGSSSSTWWHQYGNTITNSSKLYYSTVSDNSAVLVTSKGNLTLNNSQIWSSASNNTTIWASPSTSSLDSSSFYGQNAAVLADSGSVITLNNDSIFTTGNTGHGVYVYGAATGGYSGDTVNHSTINMSADTIVTKGNGAQGLYAAYGGVMNATNLVVSTNGNNANAIAIDAGGQITVTGGTFSTSGNLSAVALAGGYEEGGNWGGGIYCTGATLNASGSEAIVVAARGIVSFTNCTINSTFNKWGALFYQNESNTIGLNNYSSNGSLTISGGSFTYTGTTGGMFYVTNQLAHIYLNGATLVNNCDTLLRCMEGSWGPGTTPTTGGNTIFNCTNQVLTGMIYADANSQVSLALTSSSAYTGSINPGNVAQAAQVSIDASSTWTLTGDSYIFSLSDSTASYSNINANGHHLYVNGTKVL